MENNMFKTISNQSKRLDLDIFRLNPINQFLIKKYPREQDKRFLRPLLVRLSYYIANAC